MSYEFKFILSNILWIISIISLISTGVIAFVKYNSTEKDRFGIELNNIESYIFNNFKKVILIVGGITVSSFFLNLFLAFIYRMFFR